MRIGFKDIIFSLAIAMDNAILLEWGYSAAVVFLAFDEIPKLLQIVPFWPIRFGIWL